MNSFIIGAFLSTVTLLGCAYGEDMIRQCECSEVEHLKDKYEHHLIPCADECREHATALGADYKQLKECITAQEGKLKAAALCAESKHSDSCAHGKSAMLPKRYPETLKITALSEINRMLMRSGVSEEVRGLLGPGKKMFNCVQTCMDKRSGEAAKKLGCQLALPSDTVLVENVKQCVVQSGIGNEQIHQTCKCAARAGVKHLTEETCNKLTIS